MQAALVYIKEMHAIAEILLKWHRYLWGRFLSSEQTIKVEPWRVRVNNTLVKGGSFPTDIGRPTLGVKLLGGAVSRDKGFIEGLAMKRAYRAAELMHLLPQLRDPQSELLLLRSCMGIAKLFFGLRTCQLIHREEAAMMFDKELREAVEDIVVGGGPFFGDLQWRLTSLPIRFGGFGLY